MYLGAAFLAWEDLNCKALNQAKGAWYQILWALHLNQPKAIASNQEIRERTRRIRFGLGRTPPSLLELSFNQTASETKCQLVDIIPTSIVVDYIRKNRASVVIRDFCHSWVTCFRARRDLDVTHLVVSPPTNVCDNKPNNCDNKPIGFNGFKRQRTVWGPGTIPFQSLVRLYRQTQRGRVELRKEGKFSEIRHALFCMWLVNPLALLSMISIFLIGDVVLPVTKKYYNRMLRWLQATLRASRLSRKRSSTEDTW